MDDTDLCKMGGLPGDMMDVFGVWNEEIDSLPDGMKMALRLTAAVTVLWSFVHVSTR